MHRLPGLHGGVQVVEQPAGRPHGFLRRRRAIRTRATSTPTTTRSSRSTRSSPAPSPTGCSAASSACTATTRRARRRARPRRSRKTALGPVVFNQNRCIGCRACMQACPFLIPKYDYENLAPLIHKCTFCADRVEAGLKPACATVCPTAAISFGDRDDMVAEAKRADRVGARARTSRRSTVSTRSAGPASCTCRRCRSSRSATSPACRRRRCRTSRTAGCASRRTSSPLLYAVFAALTWITHRRSRKQRTRAETA